MTPSPILGVVLHGVGALSSASCYTPQKQTKQWSWEIYWISQATCAWLILPIVFAFLTIPDYLDVLAGCDRQAMMMSFGLGVVYGIGGLSFGLGIRYIGFSLNYAIAIGISAGLGTIFPLIWRPHDGFVWEIAAKFSTGTGQIVLMGIVISLVGIGFCGWAGALRERSAAAPAGQGRTRYAFRIGVPLAILAGVFSAVFKFALLAGVPLEEAAVAHEASLLLKKNAVYPFSHGGAWVVSFVWCAILICRNRTGSQFVRLPNNQGKSLPFYYLMALLSGAFWYFQFFFYGMGEWNLGKPYEFTSWALHMSMLILFSNVYGWLFREWEGATTIPKKVLHVGMLLIVVATLIIAYGNHRGQLEEAAQQASESVAG